MTLEAARSSNREGWVERQGRDVRLLPGRNGQGRVLGRLGLVAEGTSRLAMHPSPSKLRHPVVTEFRGLVEGVRTMALVTALAELALVLVVLLVAVKAAMLADLIALVDMARHARNRLVLTFERIALVVEILAPRRVEMQKRGMALLAVFPESPLVRIAVAVATGKRPCAVEAPRVAEHTVVLDLLLPVEPD